MPTEASQIEETHDELRVEPVLKATVGAMKSMTAPQDRFDMGIAIVTPISELASLLEHSRFRVLRERATRETEAQMQAPASPGADTGP